MFLKQKPSFLILTLFLILISPIIACDSTDEPASSTQPNGTIKITSASPSAGLTGNTPTTFTVTVSYSLSGAPQGELSIGFNNGSEIGKYILVSSAAHIVSEGSGTHTFTVDATTKDWGIQGNFKVLVNISEYPHGATWVPLDSDTRILTFNHPLPSGTIAITSVSPSSGLIDGTLTTFTVEVTYTLSSVSQGELSIGFNNGDDINDFYMEESEDAIVSEGTGTHTFTVNATTKNWGVQGDFRVLVNISEYPHGDTWVALDYDLEILTFQ